MPRFLLQTRYLGNGAQCKVRNFGVFPRMRDDDGHGKAEDQSGSGCGSTTEQPQGQGRTGRGVSRNKGIKENAADWIMD